MSTKGKSLVGFMTEAEAKTYFRKVCSVNDHSDTALAYTWSTACHKLGPPMDRAGRPTVHEIPEEYKPHIEGLKSAPWFKSKLDALSGATFQMVEINPLLAMQFSVDTDRSETLTNCLKEDRSMEQLLGVCLPLKPPNEKVDFLRANYTKNSSLVLSKNLSLKIHKEGAIDVETLTGNRIFVGVELVFPLPLVHVVKFDGKCYLHNGFHRAYGASLAGHVSIPCIYREVSTAEDVGISKDQTFSLELLNSSNPPTIGHFTQNRALDIRLKDLTTVIQVGWSEYLMNGD